MIKVVKKRTSGPYTYHDVYDGGRLDDQGDMYCVAPCVSPENIDACWSEYVQRRATLRLVQETVLDMSWAWFKYEAHTIEKIREYVERMSKAFSEYEFDKEYLFERLKGMHLTAN